MQNKLYILFLIQAIFIICSLSFEPRSRKNNSTIDLKRKYGTNDKENYRSRNKYINDDRDEEEDEEVDDYNPPLVYYNDYRSSSALSDPPEGNYRTRSRWHQPVSPPSHSSFLDGLFHGNDWSRYDYMNSPPVPTPSVSFDSNPSFSNGPTCHSLVDPQYPIFSDTCGAVPQARYSLTNAFGHRERWQIAHILNSVVGSSTDPACTRSLRLLLCPVLFPPCQTRNDPPPVLPCQSYCRAVKSRCAIPALDLLPCDILPHSSDICPTSQAYGSFIPPSPYPSPAQPLSMAASNYPMPPSFSALQSLLSPQGIQSISSSLTQPAQPTVQGSSYSTGTYTNDGLTPKAADYSSNSYTNDYRQNFGFLPMTRSSTEARATNSLRSQATAKAPATSPIVKA